MTELVCLGGPWHGRFIEPDDRMTVSAPAPTRLDALPDGDAAEPDSLPLPRKVTYHRTRVLVPGWRFPLNVLTNWTAEHAAPDGVVLPGYVVGVPGECEPDHNAPPTPCRCGRISAEQVIRQLTLGHSAPIRSACHLDHCPKHGLIREKGRLA